ncbi:MAG TPA: tryptophan 7-halogenase [Allosphingosinicella sp.]|nr:tryptophan 7-halogenase [Allosphingosinicella sp.]
MERPRAIRSILVLGGGLTGLSAAAAFAKALPRARITLVALPPDPAALADRMPGSLPAIHHFHAAIGLDEAALLRSGAAAPRLALRFEHWSASGASWLHVYGDHGLPLGAIPFHQVWAAARRAGRAAPFHFYAAAGALAAGNRFAPPNHDPQSLLSTFDYALRLEPDTYAARLAAAAGKRLLRARGEFGGVQMREDGGVASILLKDGRRFEADLFLDCAGPAAPLLGRLDSGWEDWSPFLPADRLLIGTAPAAPSPSDLVSANSIGWCWSAPGREEGFAGFAYASAIAAEAWARRAFAAEAEVEDAELIVLRPGRRPRPWVRNVLALGDSAVAVDPLQWTNLALAHSAISRALELLPGRDCHPVELAEYNRRAEQEARRVRDVLALHYLRSGRAEGDFWRGLADRPLPDSLDDMLHHFLKRGRLPFHEEELFTRDSRLAILFGLGLAPEHLDPAAAAAGSKEALNALQKFEQRVQAETGGAPAYTDFLRGLPPQPSSRT